MDFNYERAEIAKAVKGQPADEPLRLKIVGQSGETRWLNVTTAQVAEIAKILS